MKVKDAEPSVVSFLYWLWVATFIINRGVCENLPGENELHYVWRVDRKWLESLFVLLIINSVSFLQKKLMLIHLRS